MVLSYVVGINEIQKIVVVAIVVGHSFIIVVTIVLGKTVLATSVIVEVSSITLVTRVNSVLGVSETVISVVVCQRSRKMVVFIVTGMEKIFVVLKTCVIVVTGRVAVTMLKTVVEICDTDNKVKVVTENFEIVSTELLVKVVVSSVRWVIVVGDGTSLVNVVGLSDIIVDIIVVEIVIVNGMLVVIVAKDSITEIFVMATDSLLRVVSVILKVVVSLIT